MGVSGNAPITVSSSAKRVRIPPVVINVHVRIPSRYCTSFVKKYKIINKYLLH